MIIHSIMPIEEVLSVNQWDPEEEFRVVEMNQVQTEVRLISGNTYEVQRIYSTDIRDYLNPAFQPGTQVNIN